VQGEGKSAEERKRAKSRICRRRVQGIILGKCGSECCPSGDALPSHPVLASSRQLYELARGAKDFSDAQQLQMLQDLAVPILGQFHTWLETQRPEVLPESPMAEASGYALNNRARLVRDTEAGFLAIDQNVAEREMKRIALGRKNWLSAGSPRGGRTAAWRFSFTSACQRRGVEPWAYLQDVLMRWPATRAGQLGGLLPDHRHAARGQDDDSADVRGRDPGPFCRVPS
jgi:hypothetical protein